MKFSQSVSLGSDCIIAATASASFFVYLIQTPFLHQECIPVRILGPFGLRSCLLNSAFRYQITPPAVHSSPLIFLNFKVSFIYSVSMPAYLFPHNLFLVPRVLLKSVAHMSTSNVPDPADWIELVS